MVSLSEDGGSNTNSRAIFSPRSSSPNSPRLPAYNGGTPINVERTGHHRSGNGAGTYCQKFRLDEIVKGTNTVICGRRLQGKSHILCEILQSRRDAKVIIFSSKYVAASYKKYFSTDCIYDHYDSRILKRLLDGQQRSGPDRELIVAFDDVAVNKDLWKDESIRNTIRYGSSLGVTSVFSIQYAGQLDDTFKRNIDYIFFFKDNILANQKLMFTEFAGMFPTFEEFKTILDECISEPYRCLVLDLKTPRKDHRQSVFWYKATEMLPTRNEIVEIENGKSAIFKSRIEKFYDFIVSMF